MAAPSSRPLVVAHRGNSSVAPQNTLAALEAAWRCGADLVEIDVQLTADGHPVVLHDATVDATTDGTGAVADLTLAEVRALDAGSWFSPAFAGQRVPTFDEVAELLVARPGIDLLLELKGRWTAEDARRLVDPLRTRGLLGRVVGQSFDDASVAALREVAPDLRRALLLETGEGALERCAALDVVAANPPGLLLLVDPDVVARLHADGRQVMLWTLDEPAEWEFAVGLGVDAIITDRPDRLVGWLAARAAT